MKLYQAGRGRRPFKILGINGMLVLAAIAIWKWKWIKAKYDEFKAKQSA